MTNQNKTNKVWLFLAFSSVILSSSGMYSLEAYAQVLPNQPVGIVQNNVQSTSGTTSSNQMTLSNFAPGQGNNEILIVGISANNSTATSVTFNGMPLIRSVSSNQNNDAEIWYLTNPIGNGNIVVNMSAPTQLVVGAYSFANVDLNNPIVATTSKYNTSPSDPSITLTTKYVGDWMLDVPSIYGGSALGSPTCTQGWNDTIPDEITGASSSREAAYPAMVTCNWKASQPDFWDDVAVDLKAAGSTIFGINVGNPNSIGVNSTIGAIDGLTSITVYAHRIPAPYWDPCFATTCSAGTGPGVGMWVVLYDSSLNAIQAGFADENGLAFSHLNPTATYYVSPTDCDNCHGSTHDVVFQFWGDNHSNARPRAANTGQELHAWYSCTNNCTGGP